MEKTSIGPNQVQGTPMYIAHPSLSNRVEQLRLHHCSGLNELILRLGTEPRSPALQVDSLPAELPGKPNTAESLYVH